jgi:hypothetical protein
MNQKSRGHQEHVSHGTTPYNPSIMNDQRGPESNENTKPLPNPVVNDTPATGVKERAVPQGEISRITSGGGTTLEAVDKHSRDSDPTLQVISSACADGTRKATDVDPTVPASKAQNNNKIIDNGAGFQNDHINTHGDSSSTWRSGEVNGHAGMQIIDEFPAEESNESNVQILEDTDKYHDGPGRAPHARIVSSPEALSDTAIVIAKERAYCEKIRRFSNTSTDESLKLLAECCQLALDLTANDSDTTNTYGIQLPAKHTFFGSDEDVPLYLADVIRAYDNKLCKSSTLLDWGSAYI